MFASKARKDQRGVSLGLQAVVVCMIMLALTLVGAVITVRAAAHKARTAADLGALAAAQNQNCKSAQEIVKANHGELLDCQIDFFGKASVKTSAKTKLKLPGVPNQVEAQAQAIPKS